LTEHWWNATKVTTQLSGWAKRNISCFANETLCGVYPEARWTQGDSEVKAFATVLWVAGIQTVMAAQAAPQVSFWIPA
jgi:hypothetical protein